MISRLERHLMMTGNPDIDDSKKRYAQMLDRLVTEHVPNAVNFASRQGPKVQSWLNKYGPAIAANMVALGMINEGTQGWAETTGMTEGAEHALYAAGVAAVNAGLVIPASSMGIKNYARLLLGKPQKEKKPILCEYPFTKSVILGMAIAALAAHGPTRDSLYEATIGRADEITDGISHETPSSRNIETVVQHYQQDLVSSGATRAQEEWSVYAQDLRSGDVLINLNTDAPRWAASVNKIFFMLAYYHALEAGETTATVSRETIEQAIRFSGNVQANAMLDAVGVQEANSIIDGYGFGDTELEQIPQSGRTTGNVTSAQDLARLLTGIFNGQYPHSEEMQDILSLPSTRGHLDRLVDATCIPIERNRSGGYISNVMDKTGFIYGANTEAGLLTARFATETGDVTEVPYIVIALIQDRDALDDRYQPGVWGPRRSGFIRQISEIVYWELHEHYTQQQYNCRAHNGRHPHD